MTAYHVALSFTGLRRPGVFALFGEAINQATCVAIEISAIGLIVDCDAPRPRSVCRTPQSMAVTVHPGLFRARMNASASSSYRAKLVDSPIGLSNEKP